MILKQTAAGIALVIGFLNLVAGNPQVSIFLAVMAIMIALESTNDHH